MQPHKERFFLDSKHSFDDPTTTLPTLEAFGCPFVDNDDDESNPVPTSATNPPADRGVNDVDNRGANTSSNKESFPEVATLDK